MPSPATAYPQTPKSAPVVLSAAGSLLVPDVAMIVSPLSLKSSSLLAEFVDTRRLYPAGEFVFVVIVSFTTANSCPANGSRFISILPSEAIPREYKSASMTASASFLATGGRIMRIPKTANKNIAGLKIRSLFIFSLLLFILVCICIHITKTLIRIHSL